MKYLYYAGAEGLTLTTTPTLTVTEVSGGWYSVDLEDNVDTAFLINQTGRQPRAVYYYTDKILFTILSNTSTSGGGDTSFTYTVKVNDVAYPGAYVEFFSDEAKTARVAYGYTDVNGSLTVSIDAGTIYITVRLLDGTEYSDIEVAE